MKIEIALSNYNNTRNRITIEIVDKTKLHCIESIRFQSLTCNDAIEYKHVKVHIDFVHVNLFQYYALGVKIVFERDGN